MATERLPMRKLREILRLKWVAQRSHREVARSLGVSAGTVAAAVGRARARALTWEAVEALSDEALERLLFGPPSAEIGGGSRPEPDLAWLHQELRRPGVTLELLHVEYLAAHPTGYRYSAFCGRYRAWRARQRLSMRQVHTAGEKAFVDYAGMRPTIVDAVTGEVIAVELFVAVLGASNYTFAEATRTQQSVDWIASHVHARRVLWRRPGGVGAGPIAHRRHGAVPLRAGRAADVRRVGRSTITRSSFRRVPRNLATKRRPKSPCRSPNDGFWRGCATRPSSGSTR